MKTLIVAPSWIGDTLMAYPLMARLAERGAQIDVLAPAWSAPLLERMPMVGRHIASPFGHGDFAFRARRALGHRLRDAGYETAYILPNSWKSALVPYFARIPIRIGYTGEARIGLLNRRHRLARQRHPRLVDRYLQLAEPPGRTIPQPIPQPRLQSDIDQQRQAHQALGLMPGEHTVVLCPGAEFGPAKRWPSRHFAALTSLLPSSWAVWILGSDKDAPIGDDIARETSGRAINLCGKTTLTQAIDLIASASAVVSNDSGLMHVAAALDRPLVALYGSSSPGYTPPLSPRAHMLSLGLPCSPCFKRTCPLGHLDCLQNLAPADVRLALNTALSPSCPPP